MGKGLRLQPAQQACLSKETSVVGSNLSTSQLIDLPVPSHEFLDKKGRTNRIAQKAS